MIDLGDAGSMARNGLLVAGVSERWGVVAVASTIEARARVADRIGDSGCITHSSRAAIHAIPVDRTYPGVDGRASGIPRMGGQSI